jgi:glutaminyl-peptide cyclotransferase
MRCRSETQTCHPLMRAATGRRYLESAFVVLGSVFFTTLVTLAGCKSTSNETNAAGKPPFMSTVATPVPAEDVPPPSKTDGFDGKKAYEQVAKQVSYGPRPAGSPALAQLQQYIEGELKSYGCTVDVDNFSADTPAGRIPMKNFLVKIPGEQPGIILLGTHYDTKRLPSFVGADDGGSSTGLMLEIARNLCRAPHEKYGVWIAFFDGEEAVNVEWQDPDNTYGSREMAAKMAISGDLKNVHAFLLADLVGGKNSRFRKDDTSTPWLNDLVWGVAAKLGYSDIFLDERSNIGGDDHFSFTKRKIPAVDVIDLNPSEVPYWHTAQDDMSQISARKLAVVGHVFLESVKALQAK